MYRLRFFLVIFLAFLVAIAVSCNIETKNEKPKSSTNKTQIVSDKAKIVAFGDSLTAGFGLTEKESYPYLLQQKLTADGFDYEVINAGVSGDTTAGGIERLEWSLGQENVQILILELGGNDLLRGLSPAKMKENLEIMIKKAKAKNIKILLCGMIAPPTMGSEYAKDFTFAFPDLAEKYKLDFLPFILENVALNPKLNQADGIHPNAEGSLLMTENVYKSLKPLLKK
jgi:acyl-CoA thioesterase I